MSQENPQPLNIQPLTRKQLNIAGASICLFYIPPPRAFVAVASDIIQVFIVAAAIFVPVIVLLVTIDISHTASVGNQVVERVTARLDSMREQIVLVLYSYILAIFWIIFVKLICTWLDYDNFFTAWIIDRPLIALSGGVVVIVLIQSAVVLDSILKYVDFLNWARRLFKGQK